MDTESPAAAFCYRYSGLKGATEASAYLTTLEAENADLRAKLERARGTFDEISVLSGKKHVTKTRLGNIASQGALDLTQSKEPGE